MKYKIYTLFVVNILLLAGCNRSNDAQHIAKKPSTDVENYLNQQLQQDKRQITQSLNSYFQCRYDYSPRKAEMCSHVLVVPDEAKVLGSWFGMVTEQEYTQEQLANHYFKFYSLTNSALDTLGASDEQSLPYQIIDNGIERVCSKLGKYEITVTKDRRRASVNCGNQEIFNLEYWDGYWKVVGQK